MTTCGGIVSTDTIIKYPASGKYGNNKHCVWDVDIVGGFCVKVTMIDVEQHSRCNYDYLQVGNQKHCGRNRVSMPPEACFSRPTKIVFRSDHIIGLSGFQLEIKGKKLV